MSNKGRLRPCDYTTDPAWHQARKEGFAGPVPYQTSNSAAATPSGHVPDSPGGSVFEPDSGDDSRLDEDGDRQRARRGSGSTASVQDSVRKPPSFSAGRTQAAGKGVGKKLPQAPPTLFSPPSKATSLPGVNVHKLSSQSVQSPQSGLEQALPIIKLGQNRRETASPGPPLVRKSSGQTQPPVGKKPVSSFVANSHASC